MINSKVTKSRESRENHHNTLVYTFLNFSYEDQVFKLIVPLVINRELKSLTRLAFTNYSYSTCLYLLLTVHINVMHSA